MTEGPYRESALPKRKPRLSELIAQSHTAIRVVGALAIVGFVLLIVALIELPGLLVLHFIPSNPSLIGSQRFVVAAGITVGMFVFVLFGYKFVRGFFDVAYEIGSDIVKKLTSNVKEEDR